MIKQLIAVCLLASSLLLTSCHRPHSVIMPPHSAPENRTDLITSPDTATTPQISAMTSDEIEAQQSPSEEQLQYQRDIIYNQQQQVINSLRSLSDKQQYTTLLEATDGLEIERYHPSLINDIKLYQAKSFLMIGDAEKAQGIFKTIEPDKIAPTNYNDYLLLQAEIDFRNNLPLHSATVLIQASGTDKVDDTTIWSRLQLSTLHFLSQYQHKQLSETQLAWIDLAAISKKYSNQSDLLIQQTLNWQSQHPTLHPSALNTLNRKTQSLKNHDNIAIILPLTGKYKELGHAVQNGITYAFYQDKDLTNNTHLHFYDSAAADSMKSLYKKIIHDKNTLVIGPLTKANVDELTQRVSPDIPTITLNYASKPVDSAYIYQFGLSPLDEAKQAAIMAWRKKHQNALIIAPDTIKGKVITESLATQWKNLGGNVTQRYFFPSTSTELSSSLSKVLHVTNSQKRRSDLQAILGKNITFSAREREDFDVILLVADTAEGKQIKPLLKFYYVNQPVYSIASISESPNAAKEEDLSGIIFCDMPWIIKPNKAMSSTQTKLARTWKGYQATKRLYALGIDSVRLSQQLERFKKLPLFPYQGNTGEIYLDQQSQLFYRQLPCARFSYGAIRSFT